MTRATQGGVGPAAALAALTGIWGYNWVVMKVALLDAAPLSFAALRAGLGAAALFVVLLLMRRPLAPTRGWALILVGLTHTLGFVGLVALALEHGAAGRSAVLAYTMPLWTLILAALVLGERVRGGQWIAFGLAGAGLLAILNPWQHGFGLADSLLSLGAAWSWALGNVIVKRMDLGPEELLNVSAWQTAIGALGLVALAFAFEAEMPRFTPSFSLALAYNVLLATALAWLLWLYALSRLSASATGLAALGTPVFSLLAAWLQLGEVPTHSEAIGMALILAGLAVLSVTGWRRFMRTVTGA